MENLRETQDTWEAQQNLNKLCDSIQESGYKISRSRKYFYMKKRMNQMSDSNQSQSTRVEQIHLFDVLLGKFAQLQEVVVKAATEFLQSDCDIIMTNIEKVRSVIPDAAPSQDISTCLNPEVMDNPNDELQKHPSRPDAINSKPERESDEVDNMKRATSSYSTIQATQKPENDKEAVEIWKFIAESLLTMAKLELVGESEVDTLTLAISCMPDHESERVLPGNDFITSHNAKKELGVVLAPLLQLERLLSEIPNAQDVAFFILCHLSEEHHDLLSCTTIFTEEHTPDWRGHILFEKWTEEENAAFVLKFSRLVRGSWDIKSVLQKWHELFEVSTGERSLTPRANNVQVLRPIIVRIFSLVCKVT